MTDASKMPDLIYVARPGAGALRPWQGKWLFRRIESRDVEYIRADLMRDAVFSCPQCGGYVRGGRAGAGPRARTEP